MTIEVHLELTPESRKLLRKMKVMGASSKRKALKLTAGRYMAIQRERIREGKDVEGIAFKQYKEPYRTLKEKAGRLSGNFWLRLTGKMLKSQTIKVFRKGRNMIRALIYFTGARPRTRFKARGKKKKRYTVSLTGKNVDNAAIAERVDKKRSFLGVNDKEATELVEMFFTEAMKQEEKEKAVGT